MRSSIDEVQRMPELSGILRGLIDQGGRRGKKSGRSLLLGSASIDLLRQSETLAGRLWIRGGFPESFLADSESRSLVWRQDFIRTYLERDIPQLGSRIPATTLAHGQGRLFNAAQ